MKENLFGRICGKLKRELGRLLGPIFLPHQYLKKTQCFLEVHERIINSRVKLPSNNESEKISCVIFSKDRPLQLLSLISSFQHFVSGPCPVHLIYNTSEKKFEKAYQEFFQDHGKFFSTISDDSSGFKSTLLNTLASLGSQKVFFLVDDIIFKKRINIADFLSFPTETFVPSLRMGNHLGCCYTQAKKQPLPEFKTLEDLNNNDDLIFWKWNEGKFDWSYPLSVDGHIFDCQEFICMVEYLDYKEGVSSLTGLLKKISTPESNFLRQPVDSANFYPEDILVKIDEILLADHFENNLNEFAAVDLAPDKI